MKKFWNKGVIFFILICKCASYKDFSDHFISIHVFVQIRTIQRRKQEYEYNRENDLILCAYAHYINPYADVVVKKTAADCWPSSHAINLNLILVIIILLLM